MTEGEQASADWKEFAKQASNLFEGKTEGVYLSNRLWSAFIRGWDAGFKAAQQQVLDEVGENLIAAKAKADSNLGG